MYNIFLYPCIYLFVGSRESLNSFRSSKKRQAPKPPKSSKDVLTGLDFLKVLLDININFFIDNF